MKKKPRIAIPEPRSDNAEYVARSLPQYVHAVEAAGGEAVIVPLRKTPEEIATLITGCQAILLPGSSADIDPEKYDAPPHPKTAPMDVLRDGADELLLQDAHNMRKPILAICYGMQSLNVWRTGTLIQDIPSQVETTVDHSAGRKVAKAHAVAIDPVSNLASILAESSCASLEVDADLKPLVIEVNSSHHQAVAHPGDGLRVCARCPRDGVIEAVEGMTPGHWVVGVQWHPERGIDDDAPSQALLNSFVEAASKYKVPKPR
jgi:putative glutamine amidotransferase